MAYGALFIGWGETHSGRERKAVELFMESLAYLTKLVEQGRVASVEPFFLEPHGGDLEGFFLVRGDLDELNKVRYGVDSSHPESWTVHSSCGCRGWVMS